MIKEIFIAIARPIFPFNPNSKTVIIAKYVILKFITLLSATWVARSSVLRWC